MLTFSHLQIIKRNSHQKFELVGLQSAGDSTRRISVTQEDKVEKLDENQINQV
jgi:hypothetical protein